MDGPIYLAEDIRRYISGDPIKAKDDWTFYVLSKQLRRYRGVAIAAAIFHPPGPDGSMGLA